MEEFLLEKKKKNYISQFCQPATHAVQNCSLQSLAFPKVQVIVDGIKKNKKGLCRQFSKVEGVLR